MSVRAVKQIAQGDPAEQDLNLISLGTGSVLLTQYRSRPTPRLQNSGSHSIVQVTASHRSPWEVPEMLILRPHPTSLQSETLGLEPQKFWLDQNPWG